MNEYKIDVSIKNVQELIQQERIEIIENPKDLSYEKKHELLSDLVPVARECFYSKMSYDEVAEHAFDVERITILFDENKKAVGMKAVSYLEDMDLRVLYFAGSFIDKRFQGRGYLTGLNVLQFALDPNFDLFCARTQNPAIYRSLETVGDIAPSTHKKPYLAYSRVAQICGLENVTEGEKIKGFYGRSLYETIPYHPKGSLIFENLDIDYHAGDALLIVGKREESYTLEDFFIGGNNNEN